MPIFKVGTTALKEHRLTSLGDIISALAELDADEGVRVVGRMDGLKGGGFIFINRTRRGYAINTCDRVFDRRHGLYVAGGMGEVFEVGSLEEVTSFLRRNAKKPLRAVRY
jgi:hypothetical protein